MKADCKHWIHLKKCLAITYLKKYVFYFWVGDVYFIAFGYGKLGVGIVCYAVRVCPHKM